jgi:hypothetical protein
MEKPNFAAIAAYLSNSKLTDKDLERELRNMWESGYRFAVVNDWWIEQDKEIQKCPTETVELKQTTKILCTAEQLEEFKKLIDRDSKNNDKLKQLLESQWEQEE